ncbi:unnamed protein product [Spirodela intermedia]|uniref:Hydrophobic seed protein domain-containing protein n=1 Tax=Spirodela intermedia TaxID=51605 RepID=A0A7I8IV03_SPIIN|nr:unnamed protein product [Spirodela intermedia]CAA6661452.1 unnamed protein product [Spirodela intermedia]
MDSSKKLSALSLLFMVFMSSFLPIIACSSCPPGKDPHRPPSDQAPTDSAADHRSPRPAATGCHPPVLPPPVVVPPVLPPPVVTPPTAPCPPPPAAPLSCPVDSLKIGACVDLLGGLVNVKVGDPAANHCCPILGGLLELEAAVCLCTTIKLKLLNLNIYIPVALKLLATCGKTPPPGFTCKP